MVKMSIPSRSHTIRFPGDLYDKTHILADQNGRTFNGQVIYLLQIGYTVDRKYAEGVAKQIEESDGQSS
jgi:hypothetical protein